MLIPILICIRAAPGMRMDQYPTGTDNDILLVVAGIKGADPAISLRAIATRLEEMRIRTRRGGTSWSASSVKALLDRAERFGLTQAK